MPKSDNDADHDREQSGHAEQQETFRRTIETKEKRKMRARHRKGRSVWFNLGMLGMVGWSVAIPTVIGVALGVWIDATWPSQTSWTLTLILLGIVVGAWNAWRWVSREREAIEREQSNGEGIDDHRQ